MYGGLSSRGALFRGSTFLAGALGVGAPGSGLCGDAPRVEPVTDVGTQCQQFTGLRARQRRQGLDDRRRGRIVTGIGGGKRRGGLRRAKLLQRTGEAGDARMLETGVIELLDDERGPLPVTIGHGGVRQAAHPRQHRVQLLLHGGGFGRLLDELGVVIQCVAPGRLGQHAGVGGQPRARQELAVRDVGRDDRLDRLDFGHRFGLDDGRALDDLVVGAEEEPRRHRRDDDERPAICDPAQRPGPVRPRRSSASPCRASRGSSAT